MPQSFFFPAALRIMAQRLRSFTPSFGTVSFSGKQSSEIFSTSFSTFSCRDWATLDFEWRRLDVLVIRKDT